MRYFCLLLLFCVSTYCLAQKVRVDYDVSCPDTVEYGKRFKVDYKITVRGSQTSWAKSWSTYVLTKQGDNLLPEKTLSVKGKTYTFPERHVYVKFDSSYEKELLAAKSFFKTKGVDIDTCYMHVVFQDSLTTYMCDYTRRISILLASARYHGRIDNPVLFWSRESCSTNIGENNSLVKVHNYYREQLAEIDGNSSLVINANSISPAYIPKKTLVEPILGDIRFNQTDPYNLLCPLRYGKRCVVGCVPIACAQLMAHYRYPSHGTGSHRYLSEDKKFAISKDFTTVTMDWDKYGRSDYTQEKDSITLKKISNLLVAVSGSLSANFKDESTSTSTSNVKSAMANFWGYAPDCMLCGSHDRDTIVGLIRRELDEGRVALVSDHGHTFLADGCDDNFLHYNMGWGGSWNGYYRTSILDKSAASFPIESVIIRLRPDDTQKQAFEIKLSKPNTLRTLLTDEQQRKLTSLTIAGPLGNDDILLLRQMLGASNEDDLFQWIGILSELDLTKAKFKTDTKTSYYSKIAHGDAGHSWMTVTDTQFNSVRNTNYIYYNFDKMDKSSWRSFKAAGMNNRDGEQIRYDNGVCTRIYHVQAGVISPMMFADCQNLKKIRLPKNTQKICYAAFSNCRSLTDILLDEKVDEVLDYAFSQTILLKEVYTVKPSISVVKRNAFKDGYFNVEFKRIRR